MFIAYCTEFFPIESCLVPNRLSLLYLTQCDVIKFTTVKSFIHGGPFNGEKSMIFRQF